MENKEIFSLCQNPKCEKKNKLICGLEDAYNHWGHEKKEFKKIHDQVEGYKQRFEDLYDEEKAKQFIKQEMLKLREKVEELIKDKEISFEEEVKKYKEENKSTRELYKEIAMEYEKINFVKLREENPWKELLDPTKDSQKLNNCIDKIQEQIVQLKKDLEALLEDRFTQNLSQQPLSYIEYITTSEISSKITKMDNGEYFIQNKLSQTKKGESKLKQAFQQPKQGDQQNASDQLKNTTEYKSSVDLNKLLKETYSYVPTGNSVTSVAVSKDYIASGSYSNYF